MPIQPPQWTEFLSCPVCYKTFNDAVELPISLGCGHTVCKACLLKLDQKKCPFDQAGISRSIEELPVNLALLQLVGVTVPEQDPIPISNIHENYRFYESARRCIGDLATHLKCLATGAGQLNSLLSRPMQRKLVTMINCQLVEEEGRVRAMRSARSLGERTVTELILQHQNPAQLSTNLWAAIRARGCQFLGPAMQEEVLKLILLALEDGSPLSRKVLVLFVVQRLESQYPQASKTAIGHVVQLLYRASCFKVTKRDEDSSLMQLKEDFRTYENLRREHDSQVVQIATEAGLRIAPEQWSSLLYGDSNHKSHMQSIIDKLQTPQSFSQSINELVIALQRTGDHGNLARLRPHLELLANVEPSTEAPPPSWENLDAVLKAVRTAVQGLVDFLQFHSQKRTELPNLHSTKFKTSLCRDLLQRGACPRGDNCTFAHSQDELERARGKNRKPGVKPNMGVSNVTLATNMEDVAKEAEEKLSIRPMGGAIDSIDFKLACEKSVPTKSSNGHSVTTPTVCIGQGRMTASHPELSTPVLPSRIGAQMAYHPTGRREEFLPQHLPPVPGVATNMYQQYLPDNMYYSPHPLQAYQSTYLPDGSPHYGLQAMGYPPGGPPQQAPYQPPYMGVYEARYPGPYTENWPNQVPPYFVSPEVPFPHNLPPRYAQPHPPTLPFSEQPETLDDLHLRRKEILVHLNKGTNSSSPTNMSTGPQPTNFQCPSCPSPYSLQMGGEYTINQVQRDQVPYELVKSVADTYAASRSTSTLAFSLLNKERSLSGQDAQSWSSREKPSQNSYKPFNVSVASSKHSENLQYPISSSCVQDGAFGQLEGEGHLKDSRSSHRHSNQEKDFNEEEEYFNFSDFKNQHDFNTKDDDTRSSPNFSVFNSTGPNSRTQSFLEDDFFIPFDPPIVSKYGPISRTARAKLKSSDPVHVTAESDCLLVTPVTAVTPTARPYPISVQTPSRFPLDNSTVKMNSEPKLFSSLVGGPKVSSSIVTNSRTSGQPYTLWESYLPNFRPTTVKDRLQCELAKVELKIHVEENRSRELSEEELLQCELKAIEQQISMKTGKPPNASLETSSSDRKKLTPGKRSVPTLKPGQVLDANIDLNTALTPEEEQELSDLHLSVEVSRKESLGKEDDATNKDETVNGFN